MSVSTNMKNKSVIRKVDLIFLQEKVKKIDAQSLESSDSDLNDYVEDDMVQRSPIREKERKAFAT